MLRKLLILLALVLLVAALALFILGPGVVERAQNRIKPHQPWKIAPEAADLHARLTIGDLHADPLLWNRDLARRSRRGQIDLPRLRDGNVALQVFTTVTKSPRGQNYGHNSAGAPDNITPLVIAQLRPPRTWFNLTERALDQAARLNATARAHPDQLRILRSKADLDAVLTARAAGQPLIGGLLGAEGGQPLRGDIRNLTRLYDAGFRLIGLTHFFDNELGGSLHGENGPGGGLTDFGRAVVTEMQARRMIIDLAHASPALARDVLAMPGTRPIVSHTGIYSACPSPRNFPDDLMQEIAAKGGLIGIGFWADVTCDATPRGIAKSILAAIRLVGIDHVALGSDHDGAVETEMRVEELAALTGALMDLGLTGTEIAQVMGGNMQRFLRESLPD